MDRFEGAALEPAAGAAVSEKRHLRRELRRFDTVLFLMSAMVVVDTIGAIAVGGAQAFTWLVVLFVGFFIPSALISAELGAAIPEEGGVYVWVRMAFGRYAGGLASLLYWAGTPMWLGGSVTVVAIAVFVRFFAPLTTAGMLAFGVVFISVATLGAILPLKVGKWVPSSGAIGQIVLLGVFTISVLLYGLHHGFHGIALGTFTPTAAVFFSVVPILLYSFVGVELPSTASEEMVDPQRDIPSAILRAGIAQALMYGIPILAVLFVLPADRVTSLHGLIDAMGAVFTVYGGSVAADGTVALSGAGPDRGDRHGGAVHLGPRRERVGVDHGRWAGPSRRLHRRRRSGLPRERERANRRSGRDGARFRRGVPDGDDRLRGPHRREWSALLLRLAHRVHRVDLAGVSARVPELPPLASHPTGSGATVPRSRRSEHRYAGHRRVHGLGTSCHRQPPLARVRLPRSRGLAP